MSGDNLYPAPTSAGVSRRNADRPSRQRLDRPHHPRFLHPAIHAQGPDRADLPGADDLIAVEPSRARPARQPEGQRRQRDAAHPAGHVEHLHLRHSRGTCRRAPTGITAIFTPSPRRRSIRPCRPAGDRAHRRQPAARHARTTFPIRNMVLQYNVVFDRAGGLAQLNNPNWPQFVSTIMPPKGDELAKGTYRPLLAPVNFNQSKPGTKYLTVWYAGPLSIDNMRGLLPVHPEQPAALHGARTASRTGRAGRSRRCPTTSGTCSSPSTASSSRSSRARPARPRSGCSRMSATSPT